MDRSFIITKKELRQKHDWVREGIQTKRQAVSERERENTRTQHNIPKY